jgi:hypothetical protein
MHRIRLVSLALTAALALVALTATAAMAEKPEFSPAEKNAFATAVGKAKFEQKGGLAAITAEKGVGFGEVTSSKDGKFDELLEGTTAPLSGKCTGLADTKAGSVLAKGTTKIGYLDTAKTKVGIAFTLSSPVHFECEKTITLVTVEGCELAELTPTNVHTLSFIGIFSETGGVNAFTQILNSANAAFETCMLKSETDGGAPAQAGSDMRIAFSMSKEAQIVA